MRPPFLKGGGGFAFRVHYKGANATCYQLENRQPFHRFKLNLHRDKKMDKLLMSLA